MSSTNGMYVATDRQPSFFGLPSSKVVDKAKTAAEALKLAGLGWKVELKPTFRKTEAGKFEEILGRRVVERSDTHAVLGNVGSSFVPLQNAEAFDFVDALVDEGAAHYHVALELKGGKEVLLVAQLGTGWKVLGEDEHDLYLILRNGHTGGRAVQELITPIRISCTNMMPLATSKMCHRWSVVHSAAMHKKIEEAHRTLNRLGEYTQQYAALAEGLAKVKLTEKKAQTVLDEVFPDRPKIAEIKQGVMDTLRLSPAVEGHRSDGWGLLNATTEYLEHVRPNRGQEGRLIDTIDGGSRRVRTALIEMLVPAGT